MSDEEAPKIKGASSALVLWEPPPPDPDEERYDQDARNWRVYTRRKNGVRVETMAEEYGVHRMTIYRWCEAAEAAQQTSGGRQKLINQELAHLRWWEEMLEQSTHAAVSHGLRTSDPVSPASVGTAAKAAGVLRERRAELTGLAVALADPGGAAQDGWEDLSEDEQFDLVAEMVDAERERRQLAAQQRPQI